MSDAQVQLFDGPLPASKPASTETRDAGARICFEGVVRTSENGQRLAALAYEAYEPMTSHQLSELAQSIIDAHGLLGVRVEHSIGRVSVGETSFRLTIWSRHRKEGLAAMDEFIDQMKTSVALWKVPVFMEADSLSGANSGRLV